MSIKSFKITISTSSSVDVIDITHEVNFFLKQSGVSEGLVHLFVPGSTAALTTIEYEPGVVNDLKKAIERIAPQHISYDHNRKWGDANGHAHVRAALLGPSLTIPIEDNALQLGTWQQIVVCDFDIRPRTRTILAQFISAR